MSLSRSITPGADQPAAEGTIPFRLRIGVSGHRTVADGPALAQAIDQAIDMIEARVPSSSSTPVMLSVISPLGEGADRLVAERVLRRQGAVLEALLPFPPQEYEKDFGSGASREEFDDLLERAAEVRPIPLPEGTSREEAYRRVGREVLERCDVLVAIWDGQGPHGVGGTGEIVHRAQLARVPLIWIDSRPPHDIRPEAGDERFGRAFRQVDRFNRARPDVARQRRRFEGEWREGARTAGLPGPVIEPLMAWITPYLARADTLADRYQRRFLFFGTTLFLVATVAVAVAATQGLFYADRRGLAIPEMALMLALLVWLLPRGRRRKFEWISHRFLSERFRSAMFLALAGVQVGAEAGEARLYAEDPNQEWLARAFEEVWSRRPATPEAVAPWEVAPWESVRRFVSHAWIESQLRYFRQASEHNRRWHHQLWRATFGLFLLTLAAAALHLWGVGEPEGGGPGWWTRLFVVLTISLPALGAALSGIGAQREYVRNSERFQHMADYLEILQGRIESAADEDQFREALVDAEQQLRLENRDWIDVMRFHQLELHF